MALRSLLRSIAAGSLRRSGVPLLLHRAHRNRHATILFYHDPAPAVLDAHLSYLGRHFQFSTLDAVVDAIHAGNWSNVPPGALVLTIDDGHRGNYELLPVFRHHAVRPTIYLCSGVVGTRRRFWFQQPSWRAHEAQPYKRMSNAQRLEALQRDCGFGQEQEHSEEARQALSVAEIEEMAPWVDFQVHTRFHPVLPQCTDAEVRDEIVTAKSELEALLGRPCRHFSYPNGDYGAREAALAQQAGFASARTTDLGWTHRDSDPYRLKAFGINDDASLDMMVAQLSGIPGYLRRKLEGSPGGLSPQSVR